MANPLWPKEHGAYGQVSLPLVTACAVAGVSRAGLLLAAGVIAGFLAHEPLSVLLGLRGPRAKRELGARAAYALLVLVGIACGTWVAAFVIIDAEARWAMAVPLAPAVLLAVAIGRHDEKSWLGETAASLAFAGAAVPVAMAGGALPGAALAVAIPFAMLFVASTLSVRVVILKVRRGGNAPAATATRGAVMLFAAGGAGALAAAASAEVLSGWVLGAAAPGLLTAAGVAAYPPPATRLRTLGWLLLTVSALTAIITTVTA